MKTTTMMLMMIALGATATTLPPAATAQEPESFGEVVENLEHREGFIPLWVDPTDGRILAELSTGEEDGLGRMIYTASLTSGLGSNPVGLDRGLGSSSEILRFFRVNDQVFAEFENLRYRADGAGADEAAATRNSFARSIIWSTAIVAEDQGRVLIDLSDFLIRDPVGTADQLSDSGQGSFSVASDRSAAITESALAFPSNVEIDALLTLTGTSPGSEVRAVTPAPDSVTLTVHHSFAALPAAGYEPREADDRSGAITRDYYDMASPLAEPVRRSLALRHRLERVDPSAQSGPVVEPIIYYLDRGTPPLIRDALIEGGNWWADAFTAAGYENAFRVELLPEDAHPLDIRYNVIQWVHRQTRGWSYGGSVIDPRTGEIIKGRVILGSQRVRQDRMIFEGLVGTANTGTGSADDPLELALARIRQLSAHEIGHTIGLAHNFAASISDRASVMDYPAPLVTLDDAGGIDTSQAYDVGIGAWDRVAISWLYGEFGDGASEAATLSRILDDAASRGLLYITDRHARGNSSAHPLANLWDNGADPTAMLTETMAVRARALDGFGSHVLAAGQPASALRQVLPPIYLYHRYQVEAAAKAIGGAVFNYGPNRSGLIGLTPVDAADQARAIDALLATLEPRTLDLPDSILALMMPAPFADYDAAATRELFRSDDYPAFSRADAAAAAGRITLQAMLNPSRLSRLADQAARDASHMPLPAVFDRVEATLFDAPRDEAMRLQPVRQALQAEYVAQLLQIVADGPATPAAMARQRLETIARNEPGRRRTDAASSHQLWLARAAAAGLERFDAGETPEFVDTPIPPGSPIGADTCWHCDSATLLGLGQDQ
ncbi:zinc-dependent metalloprotease [Maricaulis sp.]|uniref:zinc-dependent metalloprotease n=1 Tax=Maricaulis sp. TaxID=1486257 RepID=UPI002B2740DE|nr:zinc-dependent metalloprotease [Maricaulis sp.]